MMDRLADLSYIGYTLDPKSKKLTYKITDWVVRCSGEPCTGREAVYVTEGYGFLCLPRNVTQRLVEQGYSFDESDAWLDLWCHTVWQEPSNVFSHMAPSVQFGQYGAVLTLEFLGRRWRWEKTKVWRFFRKHADASRCISCQVPLDVWSSMPLIPPVKEYRSRHGSNRTYFE